MSEKKVLYRGFEIEVYRDAPSDTVAFLVCRVSDGFCIADGMDSDTTDTIKTYIQFMKGRVDDYYEHPEDYEDE